MPAAGRGGRRRHREPAAEPRRSADYRPRRRPRRPPAPSAPPAPGGARRRRRAGRPRPAQPAPPPTPRPARRRVSGRTSWDPAADAGRGRLPHSRRSARPRRRHGDDHGPSRRSSDDPTGCRRTFAGTAIPSPTTRSEARGRRSALRPGDQRRRRAARALHRRASRASRRGRGAHHVRDRLRHVAQRAAAPASRRVNGVPVRRFRVKHERDPRVFGTLSDRVFERAPFARRRARLARRRRTDEPGARRLPRASTPTTYDYCLFFSYRYYHAYHGARAAASRAILVPTAERDAAIGLSIFQPMFRGVRALMYNSPEERAMIQAVVRQPATCRRRRRHRIGRAAEPAAGAVPAEVQHPRTVRHLRRPHRREQGLQGAVRVLPGATCEEPAGRLSLVLIGNSLLPIPEHPRIRHLGFLDDADKFDAMAGGRPADHAVVLREPVDGGARGVGARHGRCSPTAKCDVLKGQCIRSNAGLYYETLRGVRRDAARASSRTAGSRGIARPERPAVLPRQLRLARHRAEVSRHVRAAPRTTPAPARHRPAARLVRSAARATCAPAEDVLGRGCRRARARDRDGHAARRTPS